MSLIAHPTRSPGTLVAYPKRARTLINRCRRDLGIHPHDALDHRRLVGWLIERRSALSMASFRQYKASIMHFLEAYAAAGDAVAEEAMEALSDASSNVCAKRGTATSGSKLKRFPARDFRRLREWLAAHPSPWGPALCDWIACALLTGLRPSEWGTARIGDCDGEPALIVDNAKATNERAHGPDRHILIGGLTAGERDMLARHLARANGFAAANDYARYMHGCATTLARVARTLWPRRGRYPTLYSARHQFSADAKASCMGTDEIAALMGHAVDTTAIKHYGRKTAGVDMVRVRPAPQDVARVRKVFRQRLADPAPIMRPPQPSVPRPQPPADGQR